MHLTDDPQHHHPLHAGGSAVTVKDVAVTRPAQVLVMISSRRGCASRGRGVAGPTGTLSTAVARRGDYLC